MVELFASIIALIVGILTWAFSLVIAILPVLVFILVVAFVIRKVTGKNKTK